jgi:hypothetical protein
MEEYDEDARGEAGAAAAALCALGEQEQVVILPSELVESEVVDRLLQNENSSVVPLETIAEAPRIDVLPPPTDREVPRRERCAEKEFEEVRMSQATRRTVRLCDFLIRVRPRLALWPLLR